MTATFLMWGGFLLFVFGMMALDLGIFHKKSHAVRTREAAVWTGVWVTLALLFGAGIYSFMGRAAGLAFLTGYLIEYSLSVDNIFVFIVLFAYFRVDPRVRHRVLFWGILGALVFRATLIGTGSALIHTFHWVIYLFGAFLVLTGLRMAFGGDSEPHPERNPVVGWFKRHFAVTNTYHGDAFFVHDEQKAKWLATPLFIVLLIIETTDIMFALDSIPAIFSVTTDTFIVFTSNVFAIMGLRSLYFLLDGVMGLFRYLKYGLTAVLVFIGLKMLLSDFWEVPIGWSLGVVAGLLSMAVLTSVLLPERPPQGQHMKQG